MIKKLLIIFIIFYQRYISPLTASTCRFTPSCSSYALQALESHGFFKGLALSVIRIFKCHPLHPGGYDPVTKT